VVHLCSSSSFASDLTGGVILLRFTVPIYIEEIVLSVGVGRKFGVLTSLTLRQAGSHFHRTRIPRASNDEP
jgi:hypothetical protein